jgi:hypothetical protein
MEQMLGSDSCSTLVYGRYFMLSSQCPTSTQHCHRAYSCCMVTIPVPSFAAELKLLRLPYQEIGVRVNLELRCSGCWETGSMRIVFANLLKCTVRRAKKKRNTIRPAKQFVGCALACPSRASAHVGLVSSWQIRVPA